jgi:uncharacterized protein (TIGR00295 family)
LSTIPSEDECIRILLDEGVHSRVVSHVCTVMRVAEAIAMRCGADLTLVRAGALLHDLGRGRTHGIGHGVVGAQRARELGLPEALVLIVQKHVGAGITPENAIELGLPPLDYMPSTMEERIVCHADNLVDDGRVITSQEAYLDFIGKGLEEQGGRMLEMHRTLSDACGVDIDELTPGIDLKGRGPCSKYL